MTNFLRTLEFLALSLWLGSDVFLSFVVAPGAFRILASRDHAGAMVGYGLWWMHMIGVVCGVVLLVARVVRVQIASSIAEPRGAVRRTDDRVDGGVAACGQPADGDIAGADGVD